jgi:hypothetical protein
VLIGELIGDEMNADQVVALIAAPPTATVPDEAAVA